MRREWRGRSDPRCLTRYGDGGVLLIGGRRGAGPPPRLTSLSPALAACSPRSERRLRRGMLLVCESGCRLQPRRSRPFARGVRRPRRSACGAMSRCTPPGCLDLEAPLAAWRLAQRGPRLGGAQSAGCEEQPQHAGWPAVAAGVPAPAAVEPLAEVCAPAAVRLQVKEPETGAVRIVVYDVPALVEAVDVVVLPTVLEDTVRAHADAVTQWDEADFAAVAEAGAAAVLGAAAAPAVALPAVGQGFDLLAVRTGAELLPAPVPRETCQFWLGVPLTRTWSGRAFPALPRPLGWTGSSRRCTSPMIAPPCPQQRCRRP